MSNILKLFIFLMSFQAIATTFVPISIKKQIKESDGLVKGEVTAIESIIHQGKIATKVTLHADKWIGLDPDEYGFVDLYYPGGQVDDQVVEVGGSPQFDLGEDVILFVKLHKKNYWVNNLGLGKFSIKKIGPKEIIVNQIFPNHPNVGQMRLTKFYELSQWVKKDKFTERFKDKYELNQEKHSRNFHQGKRKGRSIASVTGKEKLEQHKFSAIWLVLILGLLVLLFGFLRKKTL